MNEVVISKDIVEKYYNGVKASIECDCQVLKEFIKNYPLEYKRLSAIHRRRSKIRKCIEAMRVLNKDVYWGTLTFNNEKDKNLISTKRREAFTSLNKLFDYFLLVEELGEKNGRYHIHYLGCFKYGLGTSDLFKNDIWKSRRDIKKVDDKKNISGYLVKYLSKDLPRIRCNKSMVNLLKAYKRGVLFDNLGFTTLGIAYQTQCVNVVTIFDLES